MCLNINWYKYIYVCTLGKLGENMPNLSDSSPSEWIYIKYEYETAQSAVLALQIIYLAYADAASGNPGMLYYSEHIYIV